jgi:hypothetical protein
MTRTPVLALSDLTFSIDAIPRPTGSEVLAALAAMAEEAIAAVCMRSGGAPIAAVGRLRGTGRGVSFTSLIQELERAFPLRLHSPFEGSCKVSGAVWLASEILRNNSAASVAKLRWEDHALDLPMHVHDHSDRFIIVQEGRGYFHVSEEPLDAFTGADVRTVPARERDVFLFTRGVVHTFSTDAYPMTLLSCQLPFVPFDHPQQYRLPAVRWTAADHRDDGCVRVVCDPAWSVLMGGCVPPG